MTAVLQVEAVPRRSPSPALLARLEAEFAARFSVASGLCEQHGQDESPYPVLPPDAVIFPESSEEIARIVELCAAESVPVVAFGVGSSLEGHLLAVQGGVSINLSRMDQLLSLDPEDMTVTVQPGMTRETLDEHLRHSGLFFPVDPGANASLGGMAATGASGTTTVRYGSMRDNVAALEFVDAQGRILRSGSRARKSSAGYDLTHLLLGSEGTLGIISELTLRLHPRPQDISSAACYFPDVGAAVTTVIEIIQSAIPVARAELLDTATVAAANAYSNLGLKEQPMLLLEFHGDADGLQRQIDAVESLAQGNGATGMEWASNEASRRELWAARHQVLYACRQLKPGGRNFTTDVCVPISRLGDCIRETIEDSSQSHLPCPIFGHVGDGNFHSIIMADPEDPREMAEAEAINLRIMRRALAMGGSCTGEHGVGLHKMDMLIEEHGEAAVDMMRRIKRVFDPDNILNPGKIFRFTVDAASVSGP